MENKIFRMPGPKVINKLVEDGHLPGELRHDPKAVEQALQRARQAFAKFVGDDEDRAMENKIFRMPGPRVINKLVEDGNLPGELRHDPKAVEQALQRERQAFAKFVGDDEEPPSPPAA